MHFTQKFVYAMIIEWFFFLFVFFLGLVELLKLLSVSIRITWTSTASSNIVLPSQRSLSIDCIVLKFWKPNILSFFVSPVLWIILSLLTFYSVPTIDPSSFYASLLNKPFGNTSVVDLNLFILLSVRSKYYNLNFLYHASQLFFQCLLERWIRKFRLLHYLTLLWRQYFFTCQILIYNYLPWK